MTFGLVRGYRVRWVRPSEVAPGFAPGAQPSMMVVY